MSASNGLTIGRGGSRGCLGYASSPYNNRTSEWTRVAACPTRRQFDTKQWTCPRQSASCSYRRFARRHQQSSRCRAVHPHSPVILDVSFRAV